MFRDRSDAGARLAASLSGLRGRDAVVLGLPRGGVPVAAAVASALEAPLDVIVVRKLGVPWNPELAMGAIGEGGVRVVNDAVVESCGLGTGDVEAAEARERAVLDDRVRRLRGARSPVSLTGRIAVVVDDGVATGATARAACRVARELGASRVVLAVPVASPRAVVQLREVADDVVCLETPAWFGSVGEAYDDFAQVGDEDVLALLTAADPPAGDGPAGNGPAGNGPAGDAPLQEEVTIKVGSTTLAGSLSLPGAARALVLFAHGSGSSRHSARNRFVAGHLNAAGLGTLLLDLLTVGEESRREMVFDVELLANRLLMATRWLRDRPVTSGLTVGYFGASTGAAAALWAAAEPEAGVGAVVSRGGRPDLAARRLARVQAPTLLIVGGADPQVLELNRRAQAMMRTEVRLTVIPGATHLFEEPGALEDVARLAGTWFVGHLPASV